MTLRCGLCERDVEHEVVVIPGDVHTGLCYNCWRDMTPLARERWIRVWQRTHRLGSLT
jgi:hypothetical protein